MPYLIDTDIMIYSLKGNPSVHAGFRRNESAYKALSVVTYGELLFGAHRSTNRAKNLASVHRIADLFPVIEVTKPVMETFAEIKSGLISEGLPLDDMDTLIAATALVNGCTLVTNNTRHFSRISGLALQNWAETHPG